MSSVTIKIRCRENFSMRLQADELSVVHGTNYTYKNADKVEKLITKDSDNDSSLEGLLTFLAHDSIC